MRLSSTTLRITLVASVLLTCLVGSAGAKLFHTQKEALALAFPEATRVEAKTHILTPEQASEIESQSRSELESRLVTLHTAWQGDVLLGFAHIDVHTVRTKAEGLMVVLSPEGVVRSVRVLAFYEPLDYLPTARWYEQFVGKGGEDGLRVGRDIDAVSGATLSARAASAGVRRALAFHAVLLQGEAGPKRVGGASAGATNEDSE